MKSTNDDPPRKPASAAPAKNRTPKTPHQRRSAKSSRKQAASGGMETSVGQNVRAERQRQGIPIRELARRLGLSASFLSQFELGQSQAAVNTLFAIASELNLSLDELLGSKINSEQSTKPAQATSLRREEIESFEDYLAFQTGVRWRRLADMPAESHVQFLLTEYEPGSDSAPGKSPQQHAGDDYGYILEGVLTVEIAGETRSLAAGEAIHMKGDIPHRLRNETKVLARAIWFVVG